jgi:histidinol dehydrogenase
MNFDNPKIEKRVREIINDVREKKDKALIKYTQKFDGVKLPLSRLSVSLSEIKKAQKSVSGEVLEALKLAKANIERFYRKEKFIPPQISLGKRSYLKARVSPLDRVGVYLPGGKAGTKPLISSLLMGVIPARIAGVREIILTTPPQEDGSVNSLILTTAALLGIKKIFKLGGAQAIAALAFGTESVPKVDKIVGPGNIYVTYAKKLVYGVVDIDALAGPSELLVLADETAEVEIVVSELLAQGEHGQQTRLFFVTPSPKLAQSVTKSLKRKHAQLKITSRVVKNLKEGVELSNTIAPEHLSIMVRQPRRVLKEIKHAGCIFIGKYSPVAIGDYAAGPNHILPTGGTARWASPLGVRDFLKVTDVIALDKSNFKKLSPLAKILASLENMTEHKKSIELRR